MAKVIFRNYVDGWRKKDISLILSALHPKCYIKESHGPEFQGHTEVEKWFSDWHNEGGEVLVWDIANIFCNKPETSLCAEWNFSCMHKNKKHTFSGASVVEFSEGLIISIREYRIFDK